MFASFHCVGTKLSVRQMLKRCATISLSAYFALLSILLLIPSGHGALLMSSFWNSSLIISGVMLCCVLRLLFGLMKLEMSGCLMLFHTA